MIRIRLGALALAASAIPAAAQEVTDCDGFRGSARNVDWTYPTRTYANGDVRLVALDVGEPALAARHLMVLLPDPEMGFQTCALVSRFRGSGWAGMALRDATAAYDPATGLVIRVPVTTGEDGTFRGETLTVTVNQQSGVVTAE
ncbi:hypothetical protein JQC91_12900 [Jannaschia sp. Os4]|uniref:hypothetical protein n=1 Tax=Jannaschia sp. Os4 TaxID=2807617 RepID=UPI00193949D7|nr:hypothetical protein [Jannaschia sp. Os4]MBM2577199.1 hypothetical protein [Jannaschia sp. Os4]